MEVNIPNDSDAAETSVAPMTLEDNTSSKWWLLPVAFFFLVSFAAKVVDYTEEPFWGAWQSFLLFATDMVASLILLTQLLKGAKRARVSAWIIAGSRILQYLCLPWLSSYYDILGTFRFNGWTTLCDVSFVIGTGLLLSTNVSSALKKCDGHKCGWRACLSFWVLLLGWQVLGYLEFFGLTGAVVKMLSQWIEWMNRRKVALQMICVCGLIGMKCLCALIVCVKGIAKREGSLAKNIGMAALMLCCLAGIVGLVFALIYEGDTLVDAMHYKDSAEDLILRDE